MLYISVAQTVLSHGPGGTFVLNLRPQLINVLLESGDGNISGHTIRNKQLISPRHDGQQLFQFDKYAFVDGHHTDLTALAFNGDGVSQKGLFRLNNIMQCSSYVCQQANDLSQDFHRNAQTINYKSDNTTKYSTYKEEFSIYRAYLD